MLKKEYTGSEQPVENATSNKNFTNNNNKIPLAPYKPDRTLIEAVNLARTINRPLLLTGEPGCGKTKLAYDVHYEVGEEIFEYRVHSDSTLIDAIYHYDGLLRLHDVELLNMHKPHLIKQISKEIRYLIRIVKDSVTGKQFEDKANTKLDKVNEIIQELKTKITNKDPNKIEDYIRYNSLGQGLQKNTPVILLIDEIENASPDFQTDILRLLDEGRHEIIESGKFITFKQENLFIVITCNNNKSLSDAFLRRCIFHHIKFPEGENLLEILKVHFEKILQNVLKDRQPKDVLNITKDHFQKLRDENRWIKKPSLSELIDWVAAMIEKEAIQSDFTKELPFSGTLIKTNEDIEMLENSGYKLS